MNYNSNNSSLGGNASSGHPHPNRRVSSISDNNN